MNLKNEYISYEIFRILVTWNTLLFSPQKKPKKQPEKSAKQDHNWTLEPSKRTSGEKLQESTSDLTYFILLEKAILLYIYLALLLKKYAISAKAKSHKT